MKSFPYEPLYKNDTEKMNIVEYIKWREKQYTVKYKDIIKYNVGNDGLLNEDELFIYWKRINNYH